MKECWFRTRLHTKQGTQHIIFPVHRSFETVIKRSGSGRPNYEIPTSPKEEKNEQGKPSTSSLVSFSFTFEDSLMILVVFCHSILILLIFGALNGGSAEINLASDGTYIRSCVLLSAATKATSLS